MGGFTDGGLGGALEAGATLAVGYMNYKNQRKANKIAEGQLNETIKHNQWERDKYAKTLQNQTEAIGSLGASFGSALAKEQSTTSAPNTMQDPSTQNAQNLSPQASAPSAQDSQTQAPQEKQAELLPTERQ